MRNIGFLVLSLWLLHEPITTRATTSPTSEYFTIEVVDGKTERGVPLVELRTVNKIVYWTDSAGLVAFDEPGLMDREVFFYVSSPGYEYPIDGFGNRGLKLKPIHGGSTTVKIKRMNIAERLYRITGQGIYRDSVLAGRPTPLKHPALDGEVMGQDTVIAVPYRGKIYWFWGDTDRASYAIGNYSGSGATSDLPGHGGLDPSIGVDLNYFVDDTGFCKRICPLPDYGLHWIDGLLTAPDAQGVERLLARVAIVTNDMRTVERYLMQFNDAKEIFEPVRRWENHDAGESGCPFLSREDGTNFYYLSPDLRVRDDMESIADLSRYEAFSCFDGDGKWQGRNTKVARNDNGSVRESWRKGADPLKRGRLNKLVEAGTLQRDEAWSSMRDIETGKRFSRGVETTSWNQFRRRWIALFADKPGEVWFAEADTPLGPWGYARRVVTHGDYNFYNLSPHPFFDQEDGRLVYFEGTYVTTFSGARVPTPRYDYNQMMYRLAMDDPRLTLPLAVYRVRDTNGLSHLWLRDQIEAASAWPQVEAVVCFALPPTSHGAELVPVFASEEGGARLSLTRPGADTEPLFVGRPLTDGSRAGRKAGNVLEGFWEAHALMPSGDAAAFSFRLSLEGEDVRVENFGVEGTSRGKFHDGRLTLTVETDQANYDLEAKLNNGSLAGTWRKREDTDHGTWSATPMETNSMAVLQEYRRAGDNHVEYFIQSQAPPGYQPTGRELCKVWKPANSASAFNWKAKPISTVQGGVSTR